MRASPPPLRALLFDLDGTITDTNELHFQATITALKVFGLSIDRQTYMNVVYGAPNEAIAAHFFPGDDGAKQQRYIDTKEQVYRDLVTALDPTPGLIRLFEWVDAHDLRLALVTNAPRENMECVLAALNLTDRFDTIVLAEDLPAGKPDPLPYLTGLRNLGATADQAIGFEDSEPGLHALQAAGLFSIGLATGLSADALLSHGANLAINDFTAVDLWEILERRAPL